MFFQFYESKLIFKFFVCLSVSESTNSFNTTEKKHVVWKKKMKFVRDIGVFECPLIMQRTTTRDASLVSINSVRPGPADT